MSFPMGLSLTTTTGKVLASLALVGTAAGVAGLGTYGAFVSTTDAHTKVGSGTVIMALGAEGGAENRLNLAANGLVAGDTVQRAVKLSNAGTEDFAAITLATKAVPAVEGAKLPGLVTDSTHGLQLLIQSCSVAWTETGISPAFSYKCEGDTGTILDNRPVVLATPVNLGLEALKAHHSDNLLVTMTLPAAATQSVAGQGSTIGFTFTATQRAGINK
jgi:spore coat-associated protein N